MSQQTEDRPRSESIPVGVIVVRKAVDNPWVDHTWSAGEVLLGASETRGWSELGRGEGWTKYLAGVVPLELHRKETAAYKTNLESGAPTLYVVLREAEDAPEPRVNLHVVTVSPFEAADYLDSGEDIVEQMPMPDEVAAWVAAFVDVHHVEEKFHKRRRDEVDLSEQKFGKQPIFARGGRRHEGCGD